MNAKQTVFFGPEVSNARWPKNKETVSIFHAHVIYKGEIVTPVTVRCFMGRSAQSSTVYACAWINGRGHERSGAGQAGGHGYHKESAAIGAALDSAGVSLAQNIDGVGESAVKEAILAIVKKMGYRGTVKITGI